MAALTEQGPGCWTFLGAPTGSNGYSLIARENGTRVYAHRAAWELAHGCPVPDGFRILHTCDNPRCVNPSHLVTGTQADNIHDSIRKGRYNTFGIQKLNAEQVREIRALSKQGKRQKDIAAKFGIARNTVSGIVNQKSWAHLDRPFVLGGDGDPIFVRVPHVQLPVRGEVAS